MNNDLNALGRYYRRLLIELPDIYPWVRRLPPDEQAKFTSELAYAVIGESDLASTQQLIAEWRHTAEIHADPELCRMLTTPIEVDDSS